jgi:GAF domain-containing protein
MNQRMETVVAELTAAIERAEAESRRSRSLERLGTTLDLDHVLTRTLEAATAVARADAGLVSLEAVGGKPLVATLGLSSEAHRHAVAGPPDGRRARSISIAYAYPPEELDRDGGLVHSGLAVPLPGDGDAIGVLVVFSRSPSRRFEEHDVGGLEELAGRAGPAIENARRFRDARQQANLDALTGLHNRRYFHETLAREVARAHPYYRRLALGVLDLDDFKSVERPHRPPRGRRGARRGGGPRPRGRSLGGRRVSRRRRRVRRHPSGVDTGRRRPALPADRARRHVAARPDVGTLRGAPGGSPRRNAAQLGPPPPVRFADGELRRLRPPTLP